MQSHELRVDPKYSFKPILRGCLIAVTLAVALYVAGLLYMISSIPPVEFTPMDFEAELWRASPPEFSWDSIRLRMADDLVERVDPVGMSIDEVVELLGEPSENSEFPEYDVVYHLGMERHPFGVDSEWIVLRLDQAGAVVEARIATD